MSILERVEWVQHKVKNIFILPIFVTINYLLTESEVFTLKYETKALLYCPSDSEVALFITKINTTGN